LSEWLPRLSGNWRRRLYTASLYGVHPSPTPLGNSWNLQQAKHPPCDRIIDSLLFTLSNGDITVAVNPQNDYFKKNKNLLKILIEKPCLLVFDRAETVLKAREAKAADYFAEDCAEYAWLFKQLLDTEHQSKILFTSRESLADLPSTVTREIQLNGLDQDAAVALLQSFSLAANAEKLAEICDRYLGYPKALQLIAALIRDDT
jgi:predicted kinase